MGPYVSLQFFLLLHGSLWVPIGQYVSLSVFMGFQRSLCVLMSPMGPFINPPTSLSIFISPYASL